VASPTRGLCDWERELVQMQAILGTATGIPPACQFSPRRSLSISLERRGRVVLCFLYMRDVRLFVLGHLSLLAIAVLGSSL
jgi:hypothetical protein